MRTSLSAPAALAALAVFAGCISTLGAPPPSDSDRAPWFSLEGEELAKELATSPALFDISHALSRDMMSRKDGWLNLSA